MRGSSTPKVCLMSSNAGTTAYHCKVNAKKLKVKVVIMSHLMRDGSAPFGWIPCDTMRLRSSSSNISPRSL